MCAQYIMYNSATQHTHPYFDKSTTLDQHSVRIQVFHRGVHTFRRYCMRTISFDETRSIPRSISPRNRARTKEPNCNDSILHQ